MRRTPSKECSTHIAQHAVEAEHPGAWQCSCGRWFRPEAKSKAEAFLKRQRLRRRLESVPACSAVVLLLACSDSPTGVEEPRDRFDGKALIHDRSDDDLLFLFDEGSYRYYQIQADTIGYWELGRYWLRCSHPVECTFTVARTDGSTGEGLDYVRIFPVFVGPDGVKLASRVYSWIDFDEAKAMIPGDDITQYKIKCYGSSTPLCDHAKGGVKSEKRSFPANRIAYLTRASKS